MILYDYPRSSAAYRVRIALEHKRITVDHRIVDLLDGEQRSAEYREVAAAGLVPALQLDDGRILTQSLAIMRYLDFVAAPRLWPDDPVDEARVSAMAMMIACDIHPLNNQRVLNYLEGELGVSRDAKFAWYAHWVQAGFAALESEVGKLGGHYCFGDEVTAVDCCLVPQMFNARRFKVDIAAFPRLIAIDAALRELPGFAAAAPPAA
jgi:maleylacetoacetate isomerase/maleylpyruvate isomerase